MSVRELHEALVAGLVRLTDDAMFQCPFLFMEDAGTAHFSDAEVERLREYLLKGGFLLVSDYHGTDAREQFDEEIGRALAETIGDWAKKDAAAAGARKRNARPRSGRRDFNRITEGLSKGKRKQLL